MSYARWSDESNVYVYAHVGGGVDCCACKRLWTPREVVEHFAEHTANGDLVPAGMVDRILEDATLSGPDFWEADPEEAAAMQWLREQVAAQAPHSKRGTEK